MMNDQTPGIIDPKNFSLPAVENPFEEDFDSFSSALFLPRLQLEGSSSNLVKTGKVQRGHWTLITGREQFEDLGEKIDVLVLTYRTKALDMTDKKNVVASFNQSDDEFRRIKGEAQNKAKGFLYGLEFLVFIPDSKGEQRYATLFMGNPTGRVAAKNFKPILRTAKNPEANNQATLKWEILRNDEHIWEGPVVLPCTSPLSRYPDPTECQVKMQEFLDPPKGRVRELVPEEVVESGERDR
jgi:hypothetical protein